MQWRFGGAQRVSPLHWHRHCYTDSMRTVISLPDHLVEAIDLMARRLAVSRIDILRRAVREYILTHGQTSVTRRLNSVYERKPRAAGMDSELARLQSTSLEMDTW